MTTSLLRRGICAVACTIVLGVAGAIPASAENDVLDGSTKLFVDSQSSTNQAARDLRGQAKRDAQLLSRYPGATWFTDGTPEQVRREVADLVRRTDHKVPVLVAYNLPYRDCGQYSEGGALSTAAYEAWIDGFAAGIGNNSAVVILEPDGLGLIPNYVSELDGSQNCTIVDPEATPEARFAQLNYAVDVLTALPNTAVYLDATHSGWQNVSESAFRLLKVDVEQTDGFYLNASNYQYTSNQVQYGTWVSACITAATTSPSWTGDPVGPLGSGFPDCPNQYWNGGPATGWAGTALSPYEIWETDWDGTTEDLNNTVLGINSRYATMAAGTTHFVIDTSRNGQGPWDWAGAGYASAGVAQDWCNPPDRGLGIPPTTDTGNDLVDAYLWIKVPGESDGACTRDGSAGDQDPERGMVDPDAGDWFKEQARELIELANPDLALPGNHHHHNAWWRSHH